MATVSLFVESEGVCNRDCVKRLTSRLESNHCVAVVDQFGDWELICILALDNSNEASGSVVYAALIVQHYNNATLLNLVSRQNRGEIDNATRSLYKIHRMKLGLVDRTLDAALDSIADEFKFVLLKYEQNSKVG